MKLFDIFFLVLSIGIVGTSVVFAFTPQMKPEVEIKGDQGTFLYPMDQSGTYSVTGPLGETKIRVEADRALGSKAYVLDSPCTNKLCLAMGKIEKPGQWVACLPNHVFVRIVGQQDDKEGIDASSY